MKVGLAGLGWAAQAFHVPALQSVPGTAVVGGADPSSEQRAAWTKATGTPAFETLAELLEETGAEAVVIATPPDSHAELAVTALEGGAHVLCEKPFVETLEQADRVIAAAAAAGRQVAVNHQYREKPVFRAVKERIGSADVGRLVFCQIWQLMDLAPWDEPVAWRAAMPNRTLFEGGVHLVDLLLTFSASCRRPCTHGTPRVSNRERRPTLSTSSRSSSPAAGSRRSRSTGSARRGRATSSSAPTASTRRFAPRMAGGPCSRPASSGGAARDPPALRPRRRRVGRARMHRKTIARNPSDPGTSRRRRCSAEIFAAFDEGTEPPSSGREARGVLAVIEAAYRSAETGERIVLAAAA